MDNYVHFNIKLADIIGLHPAIYVSELLNINEKAVRKDKVKDDCFVVDRNYITKRTTLQKEEQIEIDGILLNLGILKKQDDSEDSLILDVSVLTALLSAEEASIEKLMKAVSTSKPRKRTKGEVIIESLKKHITATNEELYAAYSDWIDAVYAKQGWMSVKSVTVAQRTVDEYCNHNLDLALQILDIASVNAYRDIQWAINKHKEDYKLSYNIPAVVPSKATSTQQLSSEVF